MKRLIFNCTFLADVVLNQNSSTEGANITLDHIPGANFLGVAAAAMGYGSLEPELAYTLFHSSRVRFVDGHLLHQEQRSLKVPLDWYFPKGESLVNKCYLMHKTPKDELAKFQPKQARSGYFTLDGALIRARKSTALKSAYDRDKRRSEDGKMFVYEALNAGQQWQFYVDVDAAACVYSEQLIAALTGVRFLGRSRSAQYGRVEIDFVGEEDLASLYFEQETGQVVVYAASPLAFNNDFGFARTKVSASDFGLEGKVLYDKCQVRTRQYAPWNAKRGTRDADRLVLDKGSVFVIELSEAASSSAPLTGVGNFRNEGLGQVLFNPSFLGQSDDRGRLQMPLREEEPTTQEWPVENLPPLSTQETLLLDFLSNRADNKKDVAVRYGAVQRFIRNKGALYNGISNSQWGTIRKYCQDNRYDKERLIKELFAAETGYLAHGIRSEEWERAGRFEALKEFVRDNEVVTVELLAAEITKKG